MRLDALVKNPPRMNQRLTVWLAFAVILGIGLAIILIFYPRAPSPVETGVAPPIEHSGPAREIIEATPSGPPAPMQLAQNVEQLGRYFNGRVGIVVQSVDQGWIASYRGGGMFPQQSVSKLWVSLTTLGQIDAGRLRLSDRILLTRADLTIFHQPILKRIGAGSYEASISELLTLAMTQSDNTANDVLFRRVGGQQGVGSFLTAHDLGEIAIGQGEKILQTHAAGLAWDDRFSEGKTFWEVREALPPLARAWAISDYATNPPDGAMPLAIARALVRLKRGELLSPGSTAFLLDLMAKSKTGPDRLRGGLSDGWALAHKTGTGQVAGDYATAFNDVGILTSPQGRHYAIVVMIGSTAAPVPERQQLMSDVTRAVIACVNQAAC